MKTAPAADSCSWLLLIPPPPPAARGAGAFTRSAERPQNGVQTSVEDSTSVPSSSPLKSESGLAVVVIEVGVKRREEKELKS
jgi:hypothetical protein